MVGWFGGLAESPPIIRAMQARPLIVRLRNWVGDVVLGLPALQRLQAGGYSLQMVGRGWARDLLAGHGWPVQTLAGTLHDRVAQLKALRAQARLLDPGFGRRPNAITFPYSFSSALEMSLAGLKAIGHPHEARGWLLHRAVSRGPAPHEMARYWELASALLGQDAPLPTQIHLQPAAQHQEQADAVLRELGLQAGYIVICPFAGGTFGKLDKSWPHFARFAAEHLPRLGREVLICPGPGAEQALAEQAYGGCHMARGVGLGAYAALLQRAALVIANDTGPGHMAAAVGAPLLSVLGPTDPAQWGAIGPTAHLCRQPGGWPGAEAALQQARTLLQA